jgi:hypothetical protein
MTDEKVDAVAEELFRYVVNDVEACICAGANYAVALMLMSYTEVLGGLRIGKLGTISASKKCFDAGLKLFRSRGDAEYYSGFKVRLSRPGESTDDVGIYRLFRCGFAHEYFAKGFALVHNNPYLPGCADADQGVGWICHEGSRVLRLHTNAYFRDLKEAIGRLREAVPTDPDSRKKFNEAIERVAGSRIEEIA